MRRRHQPGPPGLGIDQVGESRVQQRFLTHFRSTDTDLLQRWGIAWHYQSAAGTLIAQNDKDIWTLQTRCPRTSMPGDVDPGLLRGFAGRDFAHEILVANAWTPHLVVAERYRPAACCWPAMPRTNMSRPAATA